MFVINDVRKDLVKKNFWKRNKNITEKILFEINYVLKKIL